MTWPQGTVYNCEWHCRQEAKIREFLISSAISLQNCWSKTCNGIDLLFLRFHWNLDLKIGIFFQQSQNPDNSEMVANAKDLRMEKKMCLRNKYWESLIAWCVATKRSILGRYTYENNEVLAEPFLHRQRAFKDKWWLVILQVICYI